MDYLEHYRGHSVFHKLDMRSVSCSDLALRYSCKKKAWNSSKLTPEYSAIGFYLGNHVMSEIALRFDAYEPLGTANSLVQRYVQNLEEEGIRMFYYLLLICTRESRHVHSASSFWSSLTSQYGHNLVAFTQSINGSGSNGAVDTFLNSPPSADVATYTDYLYTVFERGSFSGGYGGKAWASVAKPLADFCNGRITMEMLVDTAWTLAHNNGPIFNKGIIFGMYDSWHLRMILDVQRAGQIPNLVCDGAKYPPCGNYVTGTHKEFLNETAKVIPSLKAPLDWYSVEALGSMGSYSKQKKVQATLHGVPDSEKKIAAAKAKIAALEAEKAKAQAENITKFKQEHYEVMNGVFVKKLPRSVQNVKAA